MGPDQTRPSPGDGHRGSRRDDASRKPSGAGCRVTSRRAGCAGRHRAVTEPGDRGTRRLVVVALLRPPRWGSSRWSHLPAERRNRGARSVMTPAVALASLARLRRAYTVLHGSAYVALEGGDRSRARARRRTARRKRDSAVGLPRRREPLEGPPRHRETLPRARRRSFGILRVDLGIAGLVRRRASRSACAAGSTSCAA